MAQGPLTRCALAVSALLLFAPVADAARGGVVISATDGMALEPGEGHVVIVFDLLEDLDNLRFTGLGEWLAKFKVPDARAGISALALRMPAGLYCLDTFRAGRVRYKRKDDHDLGMCFRVFEGALTYTGHLAVRAAGDAAKRDGRTSWDWRPQEFLTRMVREHPELLAQHDDLRFGIEQSEAATQTNLVGFAIAAFEIGEPALGQRLLEAGVAAGSTFAMWELGARLHEGSGIPEDRERAYALLERAARAGEYRAAAALCWLYQDPVHEGGKLALARESCEQAAAAGDVRSMEALAAFLREGTAGAKVDLARAYALVLAAAEKGHPEAQFQAGVALRDGVGVAADRTAAIAWFERGAAAENPGAANALAQLLESGRGIAKDPRRAFELHQLAARSYEVGSVVAVANAYARGDGVPKDLARADELLKGVSRRSIDGAFAYAWFLATCPDSAARDGSAARRLAQGALLARDKRQPSDYAVVAATLADAGDFIGATRNAQRAIDEGLKRHRPDDPRLVAWRAQLASYKREQPWREP